MKYFDDAELERNMLLLATSDPMPRHVRMVASQSCLPPPRELTRSEEAAIHAFYGKGSMLAKHVARTARFVLGFMEWLVPVEMTYGFRKLLHYEWLEQLRLDRKPRFRDHITHPAKNLVVGDWLLSQDDERLLKLVAGHLAASPGVREQMALCGAHVPDADWPALTRTSWWIACLFHDLAYPLQSCLGCARRGQRLAPGAMRPSIRWQTQELPYFARQSPLFAPLLTKQQTPLLRSAKKLHALLSALSILESADGTAVTPEGRLACAIAARAVWQHHNARAISFGSEPVLFLLQLCDETQIWGRQYIQKQFDPDAQSFHIRFIDECPELSAELTPAGLHFTFHLADEATLKQTKWRSDKFQDGMDKLLDNLDVHGGFPEVSYDPPAPG